MADINHFGIITDTTGLITCCFLLQCFMADDPRGQLVTSV